MLELERWLVHLLKMPAQVPKAHGSTSAQQLGLKEVGASGVLGKEKMPMVGGLRLDITMAAAQHGCPTADTAADDRL